MRSLSLSNAGCGPMLSSAQHPSSAPASSAPSCSVSAMSLDHRSSSAPGAVLPTCPVPEIRSFSSSGETLCSSWPPSGSFSCSSSLSNASTMCRDSSCFSVSTPCLCSSMESSVNRLYTLIGLRDVMRCTRAVACRSSAGFQTRSKCTTHLASGRLRPTAPTQTESSSTCVDATPGCGPARNARMTRARSDASASPRMTPGCVPSSRLTSASSSLLVIVRQKKMTTFSPWARIPLRMLNSSTILPLSETCWSCASCRKRPGAAPRTASLASLT
mmetsp:Transcript_61877/g.174427  ORF Transcript_61877/g.174427 Transcript_61877/m.174427 type:complete len:273 (+) Transcript_61877:2345-3163(+)